MPQTIPFSLLGSLLLFLVLSACGSSEQTVDAGFCSVVEDKGGAIITCPDGSETIIPAAPESSAINCSIQDNSDGTAALSCDDGTHITFAGGTDGRDGASCTIEESEDGTPQIVCGDDAPIALPTKQDCSLKGDYHLNTDRDLLIFLATGCTEISGKLIIMDSELTALHGLENLQFIGEHLLVYSNDHLSDLSGLENLRAIGGDFEILKNGSLTDFQGLESLERIEGARIISNNNLVNFRGLESLETVGGDTPYFNARIFEIYDNNSLVDLTGLDSLRSIAGDAIFAANENLISLNGLENLEAIGNSLDVFSNNLKDFKTLESLETIGGHLQIATSPRLTDLQGLENLKSIGDMVGIQQNPYLDDITALAKS